MLARASIPAVSPSRSWLPGSRRANYACSEKRITDGGRSHPLRYLGPGGVARDVAQGAHGHRQERSAGRASFLHFLRHACRGRAPVATHAGAISTEMTVVLQHQFWDLVVNENGF